MLGFLVFYFSISSLVLVACALESEIRSSFKMRWSPLISLFWPISFLYFGFYKPIYKAIKKNW